MDKNVLLGLGLLVGGGVGAYLFIDNKRKQTELPVVEPPPTNAALPVDQVTLYSTTDGPGLDAVETRAGQLYTNASERKKVIHKYGVLDDLFKGVKYKTGLSTVIGTQFGNPFNIPVVPPSVNPSYVAQMQTIQNTQGFEKISGAKGAMINTAFATWKNVLTLPDGSTFWPDDIREILISGAFGVPNTADKNLSERYDAFTMDMQAVAANLERSAEKLQTALNQEAIADLRSSGWKFVGLDQPA